MAQASVESAAARNPAFHGEALLAVEGGAAVAEQMKRILDDIQSGRFARDWVLENAAGQASFKAMRRRNAEHPIEQVGEQLRNMMPWIKANRLVDQSKN